MLIFELFRVSVQNPLNDIETIASDIFIIFVIIFYRYSHGNLVDLKDLSEYQEPDYR